MPPKKANSKKTSRGLYKGLCNPAKFYFVISLVAYVIVLIQNLFNPDSLCMGPMKCTTNSKLSILLMNAIYIIIFTFIVDLICKGSPKLSWVIVLFPFIVMLVALGMVIFSNNKS